MIETVIGVVGCLGVWFVVLLLVWIAALLGGWRIEL